MKTSLIIIGLVSLALALTACESGITGDVTTPDNTNVDYNAPNVAPQVNTPVEEVPPDMGEGWPENIYNTSINGSLDNISRMIDESIAGRQIPSPVKNNTFENNTMVNLSSNTSIVTSSSGVRTILRNGTVLNDTRTDTAATLESYDVSVTVLEIYESNEEMPGANDSMAVLAEVRIDEITDECGTTVSPCSTNLEVDDEVTVFFPQGVNETSCRSYGLSSSTCRNLQEIEVGDSLDATLTFDTEDNSDLAIKIYLEE